MVHRTATGCQWHHKESHSIRQEVERIGGKKARDVALVLLDLLKCLIGTSRCLQWGFRLDHYQRNTVYEHHNVGDARTLGGNAELTNNVEVVLIRVLEIK